MADSTTDISKQQQQEHASQKENKYGKKGEHHGFLNLYMATLPLAAIFLLDILPSRVSLMIIGHLTQDQYAFTSIFLSYSFTNFFSVFVLSLSCGLDTLTKSQLRNISYLRYALILVCLGFIPYIFCCVFSSQILTGINQPIEIIESTSICIRYLILYSVSYITFAMLRKSLLQYLHTTLLIGFMFARLCIHLMIGYALFYYTDLGFYAFLISDSVSMCTLLIVSIIMWSKHVNLIKAMKALCSVDSSSSAENKSIMNHSTNDAEMSINKDKKSPNENYFKQYLNATLIPGTISCLEWYVPSNISKYILAQIIMLSDVLFMHRWAVETFSFLVGALTYNDGTSKLTIFFTHSCWASFLLIFQMPMLGLSVAMAAIMTADIRSNKLYPAWYTFLQSMATVIAYCVMIGMIVIFAYDSILNVFYPMNADGDDDVFVNNVLTTSSSITVLFTICIFGYSIAMCFLGIFVSVGRLARGGTFMLIGYYVFGLIISIILGFIAKWKFYGIWFGFCGGFLIWCLLSALYWACTDWFNEMETMKQGYEDMEQREKGQKYSNVKNYGATG